MTIRIKGVTKMFGFGSLIAAEFVVGSHEGGADDDGNAADQRCHASGIHRAGTERKKIRTAYHRYAPVQNMSKRMF